jgi:diguanylate cyclase (GGDEF)-like protein
MIVTNDIDRSSAAIARRTLLVLFVLTTAGYLLGVFAIFKGTVSGAESFLVISGLVFNSAVIALQFTPRRVPFQSFATVSTAFYSLNLCAGSIISVACRGQHLDLFVYLFWFFPLLVVNKLVNEPGVARLLAVTLRIAPIFILCCFFRILISIFNLEILILLGVFSLSYISYGALLDLVTRYREAYIVERERAESFKAESGILESISDCFISLNLEFRIGYLNDAACKEFAVKRVSALNQPIAKAASGFVSPSMLSQLQTASGKVAATTFQAQNEKQDQWYELRCFPRLDGMSIYFRNITESIAAGLRIQHVAFHDALTDLPNRLLLRERLDRALAATVHGNSIGALLFIDLDDFKTLNDTMGHFKGDLLLQQVALRLARCVSPGVSVARVGGDEFVVMLEALSDNVLVAAAEASAVGDEIIAAFHRPYLLDGYEYACESSIGIALFHAQIDRAEELMKRADLAMFAAKAQGRNTMRIFDPAMETFVASRAELQSDLRRALQNGEFELHFQPQVDAGRKVRGAEALLRWRHPRRGMIPPLEFIPLAEECGLIFELGRWVLDTACLQLAEWAEQPEMKNLTISVNVSARQVLRSDFVEVVWEVLRNSRADPRKLKLEITESSAMQKVDDTVSKMMALRELGVGFSLDDFGTGYSSLSHLKQLPLEELKIDRSFVSDVLTDTKGASITRTLVALGLDLNLSVIAEGVETEKQRELLERQGCMLYQGYLFGPALTRSKFEAFVVASCDRVVGESMPG